MMMLHNWKARWLQEYTPEGPNEWIFEEMCGLIFGDDTYVYGHYSSYLKRLQECGHLTTEEHNAFWEEVWNELVDMRRQLQLPEPDEKVIAFPQ